MKLVPVSKAKHVKDAHPVIERYNAARQAEEEAKLKTPEGEAARKARNEEMLRKMRGKDSVRLVAV